MRLGMPICLLLFVLIVSAGIQEWSSHRRLAGASSPVPLRTSLLTASSTDVAIPTVIDRVSTSTAPSVARILFVGDIMLDRNVARRTREAKDPAYPFRQLPVGWFDTFDYAVANLEGPVTDKHRSPEKSIDFLFDPSVISVLKAQGIDAVSQANNHALDQGSPGYEDSVRRLREAGLLVFGHQVQDDAIALATTTVHGVRLALLGFNTTDHRMDRIAAAQVIHEARTQADWVVVSMHWGAEYRHTPPPDVVDQAHWLIDQGVDIVIGGHPHWVQGMERYKGKPIIYSLGNFIFDQDFSQETREGMAVELQLDGNTMRVIPWPLFIDKSQPRLLTDDDRQKRLEALASYGDPELKEEVKKGEVVFSR